MEKSDMKFEMVDGLRQGPTLKVIGVGGGGGNAVEYMVAKEVEGVEFIAANTDNQALESLTAVPTRVILGKEVTRGYGAGGDPDLGRAAAEENRNDIRDAIQGTDMLFVAAGMGGGTGTGAAPVVAEVAKELGVLTVAVVTRPFGRERRTETADAGIVELARHVDTMITIPNDKLSQLTGESTGFMDVFEKPNQVLLGAVQGIADVITPSRPHQRRLRRREDGDVQARRGADVERHRQRRRPSRGSGGSGRARPLARRHGSQGRQGGAGEPHRRPRPAIRRVRGRAGSGDRPTPIPTPAYSPASSSIRTWKTKSASRWWPPAFPTAPCSRESW